MCMIVFVPCFLMFWRSLTGEALADALPSFSLSLVGVVASYLLCGSPTAHAIPAYHGSLPLDFTKITRTRVEMPFNAMAVAVTPAQQQQLWACTDNHVFAFNLDDGGFLFEAAKGYFHQACSIAVDTTNEVLVACKESNKIVVCDLRGQHVRSFGSRKKSKPLRAPVSVAVDGRGLVVVWSTDDSRCHVYERNRGHFQNFELQRLTVNADILLAAHTGARTAAGKMELFVLEKSVPHARVQVSAQICLVFVCTYVLCAGVWLSRRQAANLRHWQASVRYNHRRQTQQRVFA